jgi:hypothetical protein
MMGFEGTPRFAETIRRAYGSDELTPPGITLDQPFYSPELHLLLGKRWWSTEQQLGAQGAGIAGGIGFNNPAGSKMLLVVAEIVNFDTTSNVLVQVNRGSAQPSGTPSLRTNDSRAKLQVSATVGNKIVGGFSVGATPLILAPRAAASPQASNTPRTWFAVIAPGDHLLVECGSLNAPLNIVATGYERPAREEELAEI